MAVGREDERVSVVVGAVLIGAVLRVLLAVHCATIRYLRLLQQNLAQPNPHLPPSREGGYR